jgi:hypothetical protein
MKSKLTVLLYELAGPALIVPAPTGITYRNQTGGYSCYQSEMEGYLVPIAGEKSEFVERLFSHFFGPKWGGWCSHGIDAETADEVDRLLAEVAHRKDIVVDRDKLNQSWEAWVHVKIRGQMLSLIEGTEVESAVLTWPNSD